MTLADVDDLEARLGRDLTAAETARAEAVLEDVSASIRLRTGQQFAQDDYEVRARVRRGMVRLSQRPVHSVASVTDRFGEPIEFEWDGLDRVHVTTICRGRAPVQVVDITYNAGPDEVPTAIVGVTASVALRSLGVDPLEGGVVSESIDGYSYRLGSAGGAGSYGLLAEEEKILARWSRPFGTIQVAM